MQGYRENLLDDSHCPGREPRKISEGQEVVKPVDRGSKDVADYQTGQPVGESHSLNERISGRALAGMVRRNGGKKSSSI